MKKYGLLLAPILFSIGCGGLDDVLNGVDGGVCSGATVYKFPNANYIQSKTVVNQNCGLDNVALKAALDATVRSATNDAQGGICINTVGTSPVVPLGCGTVNCNKGTLTATYMSSDGMCQWNNKNTVTINIVGTGIADISLTQIRDQYSNLSGCTKVAGYTCSVQYTATLTAQ